MMNWAWSVEEYRRPKHRREMHRTRFREGIDIDEVCQSHFSKATFDDVPIRKLLIANIAQTTTHKSLKHTLSKYGEIVDFILKRKKPGEKNYAFVTYNCIWSAKRTLRAGYSRKIKIDKQILKVVPAVSWNQPDYAKTKMSQAVKARCFRNVDYLNYFHRSVDDYDENPTKYVSYAMTEKKKNISPIHKLNNDCLMKIFSDLSHSDKLVVEKVCLRWKVVCIDSWSLQRKLDLSPVESGCTEINAPFCYELLKRCNQYLTQIDLSQRPSLKNATLIALAKLCPHVQSVNIYCGSQKNDRILSSGIRALANLSNIKDFTVRGGIFDKELIVLFQKNRKLCRIKIIYAHRTKPNGDSLLHIPTDSIEDLVLKSPSCLLRKNVCRVLEKSKKLNSLKIQDLYNQFEDDSVMEAIVSCHESLEVLEISHGLNDGRNIHRVFCNLKPIAQLAHLKSINLEGNPLVNDENMKTITRTCRKLMKVNISGCAVVTNDGLANLASLPKLEILSINYLNNVTDEVLASLSTLKVLLCSHSIRIGQSGLKSMIKSSPNITLMDLSHCPRITNQFVRELENLIDKSRSGKLLTLILNGTSCDQRLLKEIPFIHFSWNQTALPLQQSFAF